MKLIFAASFLAGLAASVSAIPAPGTYANGVVVTSIKPADIPATYKDLAHNVTESALAKRADPGVFLCTDAGFKGVCVHIVQPIGKCVNLAGDLNDKVSAVGPDQSIYCLFYKDFDCKDDEGHFGLQSPGRSNLNIQETVWLNDAISSYRCNWL